MLVTKFVTIAVAFAPLTLAASVYRELEERGLLARSPSAQGNSKEVIIHGCPCPGLKALLMSGDLEVTDWSKPIVDIATAERIFQEKFNLQKDFTKFTVHAAAKLSTEAKESFSLLDIRSWEEKPVAGQIVHEACMSRADPGGAKLAPRPFDQGTFGRYLNHFGAKTSITLSDQAAARKAEVDLHKKELGPLPWFNIWAESALLLCVLGDGTGKTPVPLTTIKNFFEKGVVKHRAENAIGMPTLTLVTAELIYEAYKNDLSGLVGLLSRFTKEALEDAAYHVDVKDIVMSVISKIETKESAMAIKLKA